MPIHDIRFLLVLVAIPFLLTMVPPVIIHYLPEKWWIDIQRTEVIEDTYYLRRRLPKTLVGYWHGEIDPPGCHFSGGPTIYGTEEAIDKEFNLHTIIAPCKMGKSGEYTLQVCRVFPAYVLWQKTICSSTKFYYIAK